MKTKIKSIVVLAMSIIASYLFYLEGIGINCFVFTLLSSSILIYKNKLNIKRSIKAITPALFTSLLLIIYPQLITWGVWVISYLIMWTIAETNLSAILILLQSLFSIIDSPIDSIRAKSLENEDNKELKSKRKNKFYIIAIALITSIVFLTLYSNANPILANLINQIDLSFIDIGFVTTTGIFFILLFGLLKLKPSKEITELNKTPHFLHARMTTDSDVKEFNIAKTTLWAISIILGIVNTLDIFVILSNKLPEGVTYAEFVHQGFYLLILSITIAVSIIIYFYRGGINFLKESNQLRLVSYIWIAMNIALVIITAYKNGLYVEAYGLTYKRITVFISLLCSLIGLTLSIRKIKVPTTNWNYFNLLTRYAFIAAIAITAIPYDYMITHYNLQQSNTTDFEYLMSLTHPDFNKISEKVNETNRNYLVKITSLIDSQQYKAENNSWKSWSFYQNTYKNENYN